MYFLLRRVDVVKPFVQTVGSLLFKEAGAGEKKPEPVGQKPTSSATVLLIARAGDDKSILSFLQ